MPNRIAMSDIDWGLFFHAYGVAEDTPGHLRHLASDDEVLRTAAFEHLHGAVIHQGTIYSVTPAAVRSVAGLLAEPALRRLPVRGKPALSAALNFLSEVATSVDFADVAGAAPPEPSDDDVAELSRQLRDADAGGLGGEGLGWDSELIGVLMHRALLALRDLVGEVLAAVLPLLSDAEAEIWRVAVNTAAQWGALSPGDAGTPAIASLLRQHLDTREGREERAGLVLALGKLGSDVSPWLDDPDEAVRACAALFVQGERANAELVSALTRPERIDTWFKHRLAAFPMRGRFALLAELVARKPQLEDILPAALALIAHSSTMTVDIEWGRILHMAFPEATAAFKPGVSPPPPTRLTSAQRAVVEALVANPALWDPRNGNASLAWKRVGLTNARADVITFLSRTPTREAGHHG
jgi:hypothetical protein